MKNGRTVHSLVKALSKYKNNKLDVARYISQRVLILPFYEKMQIGTIDTIIQILR